MAFIGPVEDRLKIRELYNTYSDASSRQDVDAYLACWSDTCERLSRQGELRGKPALREAWDQVWADLDGMAFFSEPGAIEVAGETAVARCLCREIIVLKGGEVWKVVGRYEDDLVREAGEWRFRRRRYNLLINERQG